MPIMTIFDGYFPLGLGASRFAINDPKDEPAIERAAELVCKALDAGMDYIDVGYNYSAGAAQSVLGLAFRQTKKPFAVTVKVSNDTDKTAEEARRRVEMQLKTMGLQKAAFFVCWSVKGYDEFKKIMQSGGVYDGALKMKAEGIIDHICCSIHAPLDETTKIIESGVFEGVTLSYSLLNAAQMLPALDSAQKHGVGVAVMNPLGGGLIAQNPDFFDFARNGEESIAVSALRFAKAHPAVNILLSGISKEAELYENISAVCEEDSEQGAERHARVLKGLREIKDFCTGCDYCKGCPADIPVSAYMLRRNRLLFGCRGMYNRSEPELVKNLNLFYDVCGVAPETAENPCTRCGACEQKCTQKLPIISWLADTLSRLGKTRYSKAARGERLRELLIGKGYKKVGLYPNGGFATLIMEMYKELFGEPDFEWMLFNSDPKMWGQSSCGVDIRSPEDIEKLRPELIIVCTYKFDNEIYKALVKYEDKGIRIVKLHEADDLPWVW